MAFWVPSPELFRNHEIWYRLLSSNGKTKMSKISDSPDQPGSPFLAERLMRQAKRPKDDPSELAQEFAFEAYEATSEEAALELADKALLVDPDCVDALTIRAFITSEDAGELVAALEHAASCGEKELGEDFFAEFMGDFWPMVEARPYMRTIKQLAEVLWDVGRRFDAVAHYENLIDLDPADHMGNSTLLLGYYLSMGEIQRSWDLLEEYNDDSEAVSNWAWVLLFLMVGDEDAARDALEHAMEANPHVAMLLVGMGAEPEEELPPMPVPGSEREAFLCLDILGDAWERGGAAQWWLYNVLVDMGLIVSRDEGNEGETPSAH